MAHGFKSGGRKPGSKNKRTEELQAAADSAAKQIAEALGEAFEGDAHAFLMAVYKDMSRPVELRIDAAKAAIRFEKPLLASIEAKHDVSDVLADLLKAVDGRTRGIPQGN